MPRAAISFPSARAAAAYAGLLPALDPQNTHIRFMAAVYTVNSSRIATQPDR